MVTRRSRRVEGTAATGLAVFGLLTAKGDKGSVPVTPSSDSARLPAPPSRPALPRVLLPGLPAFRAFRALGQSWSRTDFANPSLEKYT